MALAKLATDGPALSASWSLCSCTVLSRKEHRYSIPPSYPTPSPRTPVSINRIIQYSYFLKHSKAPTSTALPLGPTSTPRIDSLSMLLILQMNLKIAHCRIRTRRIQLSRAVVTSYSGQVHVFYAFGGLTRLGCRAGHFGRCVDGGVAHRAFEAVVGVRLLEFDEAICEPGWRSGLRLSAALLCGREKMGSREWADQGMKAYRNVLRCSRRWRWWSINAANLSCWNRSCRRRQLLILVARSRRWSHRARYRCTES